MSFAYPVQIDRNRGTGSGARDHRFRLSPTAYRVVKRAFDLMLVLATAPVWLALFAAIWAAIKAHGPKNSAFFFQQRTGQNGRRFDVIKFRTMVPGADAMRAQLMHLNERIGPDFKAKNDPRITSIGRHLRRFHLDELPQFVNILRGEMSLVGPRPTSTAPDNYFLWHTERFETIPGLTCLWQLVADSNPSFDDRMRLDIQYCRNRCFRLDLEILLRTVGHVLRGRGC